MSLPPELHTLCQQLATTPTEMLPQRLPTLVSYVLNCGGPLSTALDFKAKDHGQSSTLVHKLKTQISTLLSGKTAKSRFSGAALAKAVVDVGGRECLQTAEPWVRSMLTILHKNDPIPSKELSIVALTKIYLDVSDYQTLAREIATPSIPDFIQSCLNLMKKGSAPLGLIEGICFSFSHLIPIYPATFRPFASQIRSEFRKYLAPTAEDDVLVPKSLSKTAQQVIVLLPHSAAKNGSTDEWTALVQGLLKNFHVTADQVFRGVSQHWAPQFRYEQEQIDIDAEPEGGSESPDDLPHWVGTQSGAQRLAGLLDFLASTLLYKTKAPVPVPVPALVEAAARISFIVPPPPGSKEPGSIISFSSSISREERNAILSALPAIHAASLGLISALVRRLGPNILPFAQDLLDQVIRIFASSRRVSTLRQAAYTLAASLFSLCGPTLPKQSVESLHLILLGACRELHTSAGYMAEAQPEQASSSSSSKVNNSSTNADRYLLPSNGIIKSSPSSAPSTRPNKPHVDPTLLAAAEDLLAAALAQIPQRHLAAPLRHFIDHTAVVCCVKSLLVASVLSPYASANGKVLPSVLSYLTAQFPGDREVEVLRTNLRTKSVEVGDLFALQEEDGEKMLQHGGDGEEADDGTMSAMEMDVDVLEEETRTGMNKEGGIEEMEQERSPSPIPAMRIPTFDDDGEAEEEPPVAEEVVPMSPAKRKFELEEEDGMVTKRVDIGEVGAKTVVVTQQNVSNTKITGKEGDDDDEDDEEMAHMQMRFDSSDEEEE